MSQLAHIRVWLRILAVVVLLTALLAYGMERAMPGLEIDWTRRLAAGIGMVILYVGCMAGLLWFIPPTITINPRGVSRQHGMQIYWLFRRNVRRITIDVADPSRPLLNIEAAGREPLECGIAAKVSAADLAKFLRETFPELALEEKT